MPKLFTYGTLMSGFPNNYALDRAEFLGTATLVNSGLEMRGRKRGYPALVESDNPQPRIVGEVWDVSESAMEFIDKMERNCGYASRTLPVSDNPNATEALVYVIDRDNPWAAEFWNNVPIVESGDWRAFCEANSKAYA